MGERERRITVIRAGCEIPPGSGGSVMADEGLDGSRDKLKRHPLSQPAGIDPSKSGISSGSFEARPFVCLPIRVGGGIDCVPGVHRSS